MAFEDWGGGKVVKIMGGYHQFHAVAQAVETTVAASKPGGTKQAGVVWHTQRSGKSLTMAFFAGRVVLHPAMNNPTLVVLTDRNDLDGQLFGTFSRCSELLRQMPSKRRAVWNSESCSRLRREAWCSPPSRSSSRRRRATDSPRSPTGETSSPSWTRPIAANIGGFARHMRDALPNASFIVFTGTPVELTDANTRAVLGDYISIYDVQRAVEDGATVPIYYESRLAQLQLDQSVMPLLDEEFDEVTEGEEVEGKEKLKSKWAALEALVGTDHRMALVAKDLVEHFERRQEAMDGKGMVVCMSRRICVDLDDAFVALRPDWHSEDDDAGQVKVIMTGSASDPLEWQGHIRNKGRRDGLAKRFKKPSEAFKLVLVRDMWLTGFDAPALHTMYLDKPMRGHGFMQAIARVNRVFKDKPGGLGGLPRARGPVTRRTGDLHTERRSRPDSHRPG